MPCRFASHLAIGWGRSTSLDAGAGQRCDRDAALFEGSELRQRQIAAGYSIEELEHDPGADGRGCRKRRIASMGDDTPSRGICRKRYRPLSAIIFRQNFSQVTNPPIDSLREYRVMSLKTRFGNLKNVLDEDSATQTEILVLDSPFVSQCAV